MTTEPCRVRSLVDAHFLGEISPEDELVMREHLGACAPRCAHYARRVILARLDPMALPAEERLGRGLGLFRERRRGRSFASASFVALVAAAAVMAFVRSRPSIEPNGFASRGPGSPVVVVGARGDAKANADDVDSRVEVYRVPRSGPPEPAVASIRHDDELAFAYRNGARKERLAIFGIDEHRRVYWFYPGWTNDGDDPVAIPVSVDGGHHELGDAVAHDFTGERLEIHAVFLDQPLSVRQIEKHLDAGTLDLPGSVEQVHSFSVLP